MVNLQVMNFKTLTNMFLKICEDTKCDMEVALHWAVSVKNTLTNNHGFSPAQNAFGKNRSLLSIMNNRLSALEDHYITRDLVLNITSLHIGRQGFIE